MNQITFDWDEHSAGREFAMALGEQPQQRLEHFGVRAVSDTEHVIVGEISADPRGLGYHSFRGSGML